MVGGVMITNDNEEAVKGSGQESVDCLSEVICS